ncbi:MAG: isochorismate synthase MenF [Acidimicrobiales bacterium]
MNGVALGAVRLRLDPGAPLDPFDLAGPQGRVFVAEGRALVGLGRALTVDLPRGLEEPGDLDRAARRLASLPCDDRSGLDTCGVVAFGTLPFDRSAPGALVVPEVVYGRDGDGNEWVTFMTTDDDRPAPDAAGLRAWLRRRSSPARPPRPAGGAPLITPLCSDDSFRTTVASALAAIDGGDLAKVVLARQVDVRMPEPVDVVSLLHRWQALEPACVIFSLPTDHGQFVGASPELLVERIGPRVHCRPLAGTTQRSVGRRSSALPGELLRSAKDGTEHRLVVEAIQGDLAPLCAELHLPTGPDLVHLHTITHLGTSLTGTLAQRADGTVPSTLDLVAALHPTPAVGGVPSAAARALIDRLEPQSRGHYAGPVGVVDARGDGRWMVGIRAVSVREASARLAAGVGIVHGSRPEVELEETELKLSAVFDALAPGAHFSTSGTPPRHEAVS